ncbi:LuxE/PaaK family acyltransferase [Algoriphagus aquimarinus]|uniref:Phenylacetate-coenzyme A ligase PaaK, adenylate-forming domain family n=1 Tax=Algoriphagus aquimarinus TaxID=237018 RepID=A0A1I1BUA0_9BACT|nr:acyl transferase [Algoriphagus aquimarinus]SFB53266.1 Phenylacetate-coenzyme A ligase PaaK, adenylate-forming domain family [Algoriphagus aquimarinus]|tara:strand:+ start:362288 stop:363283 length:996 start_codon:yes stop_codon:yes gene_type:complete
MQDFKSFSSRLSNLKWEEFENLALELFRFQAQANPIYRKYLEARNVNTQSVKSLDQIPFLPIRFFKDHDVISAPNATMKGYFSSSGTTGMITSKHYFWSESWYQQHAQQIFEAEYGELEGFHVLALLPAYLERKGSSLVSMADHFIRESKSEHSGFYLYNQDELLEKMELLANEGRKVILLGVTFALLDLAESGKKFNAPSNLIVMETGGMKGRRKEMIREEVHDVLKPFFGVEAIHSEYGMTELMSQAYSKGHGKYTLPNSMRVVLRDVNDPLTLSQRSQGGINVIDLANFHSCAFIETQDLGKYDENGMLEVLGRFDNSEIRGCNLLVQ